MSLKRLVMQLMTNLKMKQQKVQIGKNVSFSPFAKVVNEGDCIVGNNVEIHNGSRVEIQGGGQLKIGDDCNFNVQNRIEVKTRIEIGKSIITGPWVYISDANHNYSDIRYPIKDQGFVSKGPLVIKDNCWIGAHSTIVGNVTIGVGCVIGANSVVTSDIPDYSVAAGVPAKVLKQYNKKTKKWESVKYKR